MQSVLKFMVAAVLLAPAGAWAQSSTAPSNTSSPGGQAAAPAGAAAPLPDVATSNYVDFGGRGTWFGDGSDEARYQRYRDERNGATLDVFRYATRTDDHWLNVQADHVGYRDQRYSASYNRFGKVKASFEWNQIPLFFSQTTSSLYTSPSDGVLLLPDSIQTGLQNKTITPAQAVGQASPFDLRLKRNVADFKLTYSATPHLDFNVSLKNTTKNGNQPWAGTFGFSDAVELAVPVDTRTTELGRVGRTDEQPRPDSRRVTTVRSSGTTSARWCGTTRCALTDSPTAGPVQGRSRSGPTAT